MTLKFAVPRLHLGPMPLEDGFYRSAVIFGGLEPSATFASDTYSEAYALAADWIREHSAGQHCVLNTYDQRGELMLSKRFPPGPITPDQMVEKD